MFEFDQRSLIDAVQISLDDNVMQELHAVEHRTNAEMRKAGSPPPANVYFRLSSALHSYCASRRAYMIMRPLLPAALFLLGRGLSVLRNNRCADGDWKSAVL